MTERNNDYFEPGDIVYVMRPYRIGGNLAIHDCMLISIVNNIAILSVDWNKNLDKTLLYNVELTNDGLDSDLCAIPLKECYRTKVDAKSAYIEEALMHK